MKKNEYIDPDEKLEFKEINIRITKEMYEEWVGWAEAHNLSLDKYIKSSVESRSLREMIIDYFNDRAKNIPWWERRPRDF